MTASTVEVSPGPSMRALQLAFALHLACLALLMIARPPALAAAGLAAAVGASWLWVRRHPALGLGPRALNHLVWHADGSWTLQRADGKTLDGHLSDDAVVRGFCLVLRFQLTDGTSASRVLLGDELSQEAMRRLRARLSTA